MRILMVSPELTPYAKVGGLGDVVGALPKNLAIKGHDVRIVLPKYNSVNLTDASGLEAPLIVNLGCGPKYCKIWKQALENGSSVTVYFLEYNQYFGRYEIYAGPWGDHQDNGERFSFLSRAAIDLCYYLNWIPDIIHCHDWTSGLLPVYLNTTEKEKPIAKAATVFTIHNLEHQGIFRPHILEFAGLPSSILVSDGVESFGHLNMLKAGLYHATKLTTVSPNYAKEIQTPEFGCGLQDVLSVKSADLIGVLNGIDNAHWNPAQDPFLPEPFSWDSIDKKAKSKLVLQDKFKLEINADIPIFSTVSRLFYQKGLDVFADIVDKLMAQLEIQVVVLGLGDSVLEHKFNHFAKIYPGRFATYIGYDNALAHLIKGGSDFFLMPSRFEPCGLAQLYAMAYGAVPIVRRTGGLADTVKPFGTVNGGGIVFDTLTVDDLYNAIILACSIYKDKPKSFRELQINGMKQDFSWNKSAAQYEQIYGWAIDKRKKDLNTFC